MSGLPIQAGRRSETGFRWNCCTSVRELNAAVSRTDAEDIFLSPTWSDTSTIGDNDFSRFKLGSAILLISAGECSELRDNWSTFPPTVGVRLTPPELQVPIVIPATALAVADEVTEPFRDVSHPVWDWLIHQVDSGSTVNVHHESRTGATAVTPQPRPRLVPASPQRDRDWLRRHLNRGNLVSSPQSTADATALRAGLLQMHDFLDDSHEQSQSIEGEGCHAAGDYWHAIMHRREPDYGNSKYWFRRVGRHPLFGDLASVADRILQGCGDAEATAWQQRLGTPDAWDVFTFVDLCAACADLEESPLGKAAREIQWQEMRLLLLHTYRDVTGT